MNYAKLYSRLINRALNRQFDPGEFEGTHFEKHHILPRSQMGQDGMGNTAFLTPREHKLAHLILWRLGYVNHILAVKCFLDDSINPHSHRFGLFRWTKYLRRVVAYQSAANMREAAKGAVANRYLQRLDALISAYEATIKEIDSAYADQVAAVLLDQAFENFVNS